jgi:putative chitinase
MLTKPMFKSLFPKAKKPAEIHKAMGALFEKYEINSPQRIAGFLAQCGHESGGFRLNVENLNYSAKALDAVFGKYFARGGRDSSEYERQPEKIANIVYASRMGNGDTASGDGWRFRGRGYIQLTGRNNYEKFAESVGMDVDEVIEYLDTVQGSLESALWFWDTNGLNKYCDSGDVKTMTKRINGGYNGLEDRQHHWDEILHMLGEDDWEAPAAPAAPKASFDRVLSVGMKGDDVAAMQAAMGISPADGVFGRGTKRAVKAWQEANGLGADGVAGPATLGKL